MYKIKNLYIGKFVGGGLIVKDMLADQELLKANKIDFKKTYDIKEELKRHGFKFNPYNKRWIEWILMGLTKEEEDKIVKELKDKYLVERDTCEIKYKKKCLSCGSYYLTVCDCARSFK